jgi:hypothetical protein
MTPFYAHRSMMRKGRRTMKSIMIALAVLALTASSTFAAATYNIKGTSNTDTNGNGNLVATYSSSGTGNGAVVGGQGDSYDNSGADLTTTPGSRAAGVQALLAQDGKGRDK